MVLIQMERKSIASIDQCKNMTQVTDGTHFVMWNVVHIDGGFQKLGGALDVGKSQDKKWGDRNDNSR